MEIKVSEIVTKNGKDDFIHYTIEKDCSTTEGRHSDLCVVCGFPTYPKCREFCPNESR